MRLSLGVTRIGRIKERWHRGDGTCSMFLRWRQRGESLDIAAETCCGGCWWAGGPEWVLRKRIFGVKGQRREDDRVGWKQTTFLNILFFSLGRVVFNHFVIPRLREASAFVVSFLPYVTLQLLIGNLQTILMQTCAASLCSSARQLSTPWMKSTHSTLNERPQTLWQRERERKKEVEVSPNPHLHPTPSAHLSDAMKRNRCFGPSMGTEADAG